MSNRVEEDYDSDRDSLENINDYDGEMNEIPEETNKINNVREAVREWKLREMDKNTNTNANTKTLQPLRKYVANSANLYYDLKNYLSTAQNKESNMKDDIYVKIISAIGFPGALTNPLRVLVERLLERDLVELPFTMEPSIINSYSEKHMKAQTEFPEEE